MKKSKHIKQIKKQKIQNQHPIPEDEHRRREKNDPGTTLKRTYPQHQNLTHTESEEDYRRKRKLTSDLIEQMPVLQQKKTLQDELRQQFQQMRQDEIVRPWKSGNAKGKTLLTYGQRSNLQPRSKNDSQSDLLQGLSQTSSAKSTRTATAALVAKSSTSTKTAATASGSQAAPSVTIPRTSTATIPSEMAAVVQKTAEHMNAAWCPESSELFSKKPRIPPTQPPAFTRYPTGQLVTILDDVLEYTGKKSPPPPPMTLLEKFASPPPPPPQLKKHAFMLLLCSYNSYNTCNVTFMKKS